MSTVVLYCLCLLDVTFILIVNYFQFLIFMNDRTTNSTVTVDMLLQENVDFSPPFKLWENERDLINSVVHVWHSITITIDNAHGYVLLVGWLVALRIYVALAVFRPYRDFEAGDNQSLKFKWRDRESNPGPHAPQARRSTTRPPPMFLFIAELLIMNI